MKTYYYHPWGNKNPFTSDLKENFDPSPYCCVLNRVGDLQNQRQHDALDVRPLCQGSQLGVGYRNRTLLVLWQLTLGEVIPTLPQVNQKSWISWRYLSLFSLPPRNEEMRQHRLKTTTQSQHVATQPHRLQLQQWLVIADVQCLCHLLL